MLRARVFQFVVPETPLVVNFWADSLGCNLDRNAPDQGSQKRSYLSINIKLIGISGNRRHVILENYS